MSIYNPFSFNPSAPQPIPTALTFLRGVGHHVVIHSSNCWLPGCQSLRVRDVHHYQAWWAVQSWDKNRLKEFDKHSQLCAMLCCKFMRENAQNSEQLLWLPLEWWNCAAKTSVPMKRDQKASSGKGVSAGRDESLETNRTNHVLSSLLIPSISTALSKLTDFSQHPQIWIVFYSKFRRQSWEK